MKIRNFTPHEINLNDGRSFPSEGNTRVSNLFAELTYNLENIV